MTSKLTVRKTRFWYATLLTLFCIVTTMLLAACGDSATPTTGAGATTAAAAGGAATTAAATTTVAAAAGPTPTVAALGGNPNASTTLQMWIMPNSAHSSADLQKVLADFYAQNPDIKVNVTELDWGSAFTKITTALTSGQGPDITQLGTTWVGAMSATGGLRSFTPEEVKSMGGSDNFTPAAWATSSLAGSKDVTAIPWFVDTRAIIYRTDVLQKAGVDPATGFKDWNTFVQTLQKMKDTGMVKAPFAYPGKNDWNVVHNFAPWIWSAGGSMLTADNSQAAFNNDAGIKGAQFYASLYTQGLVLKDALEKNSNDVEAYFESGDVGAIIDGPWMLKNATLTKADSGFSDTPYAKEIGVAMIPTGPSGDYPFVGGSNLTILKSSKHADAAVKLVQFLASKKAQSDYAAVTGDLPATNEGQAGLVSNPMYKVFVDSAKAGKSYPAIAAWGPIESALQKNIGLLWDDVAGVNGTFQPSMVKTRLDAAAQEVNTIIAASK